jgi:hypothetical protein
MTPTDYISREEVMKEFVKMKEWFTEDSDYATGIKSWIDACIYRVINTPSLPDKSLQIREMIEKKIAFDPQDEFSSWYKKMWEELLSEIYSI